MISEELYKLKIELEKGHDPINVNREKLLKELQNLENIEGELCHSLSLSGKCCPTCGRRL